MNGLKRVAGLMLTAAVLIGFSGCHTTVVQPVEQQPAQAPPPDHHDDHHPPPPPPPPPDHRDDRPQDHH